MSVLRRALGLEQRADAVDVAWPGGQSPSLDDYGRPGTGRWGEGMVWNAVGAVGNESAMRISAVYACLRLLSEAIATLPLDTFIRQGGVRRPYRPRPDYLSFQPPLDPRSTYISQLMLSMLTDGNAFVATPRDVMGVPLALLVLDPMAVDVVRKGGRTIYRVQQQEFDSFDIMHIPGMMMPGMLRGVSPIRMARDVIDAGQKAQEYGRNFLGNSGMPPGVIEMPDDADREQAIETREGWEATHSGPANAGKVGVLMGGATLKTIAVSPEDAQWLDSKRFTVSEIARFYGVPPHLIADASNSTSWGSGLAEQNLAFGQFSLRPWIERIEEAHGRLLSTHGLPDVFMKLNLDALLRASLKDRYDSYAIGVENEIDTINECRALEDKPPVPWGDLPPRLQEQPPAPGGAS